MSFISFVWMRRIDHWVGNPLARVLGRVSARPLSLYGNLEPLKLPKTILCSKFIGLGGVVLTLPLLRALKEQGVRIAFWSFEGQAEIVRLSGLVDEIYVVRATWKQFIPSLLKSWFKVRKFKAQAYLDFEAGANFSAILGWISGAKIRVGFLSGKPLREALFTHLISLAPHRNIVRNHFEMGRRLGLPNLVDASLPLFPDLPKIKNVLPDLQSRRRIVVNINPGDGSWAHLWPEDYWVELCNRLLDDITVDLVFPGSEDERDRVQTLIARLKDPTRVFNIAGTVSLAELLLLLRNSEMVVSVNSGIVHLASWARVSLVALFGPQAPDLALPPDAPAKILWQALGCSPCVSMGRAGTTRCRDNLCMKKLTPESVFRACMELRESRNKMDLDKKKVS